MHSCSSAILDTKIYRDWKTNRDFGVVKTLRFIWVYVDDVFWGIMKVECDKILARTKITGRDWG